MNNSIIKWSSDNFGIVSNARKGNTIIKKILKYDVCNMFKVENNRMIYTNGRILFIVPSDLVPLVSTHGKKYPLGFTLKYEIPSEITFPNYKSVIDLETKFTRFVPKKMYNGNIEIVKETVTQEVYTNGKRDILIDKKYGTIFRELSGLSELVLYQGDCKDTAKKDIPLCTIDIDGNITGLIMPMRVCK